MINFHPTVPPFVPKEPQLRWGQLPFFPSCKPIPRPVQTGNVQHFQQARYALYHGIRLLGLCPGDKILVPAFHCSTLIEGVLRAGADITFYNVKRDLQIDLDDVERKVDRHTKALLIVHFFGVIQPVEPIKKICEEKGLYLIEDCAHILKGNSGDRELGTFGDFSVFSWRKFFPIQNGGMLVVPKESNVAEVELHKNSFRQYWREFRWSVGQCLDSSKKPYPGYGGRRDSPQAQWDIVSELRYSEPEADFDANMASREEGWFSLNYLKNCEIDQTINIRKRHWQAMARGFLDVSPLLHSWGRIWEHTVAWAFPLFVTQNIQLHVALRKRGIPAFTWGGVIHRRLPIKEFPDAEHLYANLVLLPIHQDLTSSHLEYMIQTVKDVVPR